MKRPILPVSGSQRTRHARNERGAVLVHVAIALIGLLAFSALVIDYGVMWTARRQAQNAADAAAMAGAVSMAFVDMDDKDLARQSALNIAAQNRVWGASPDVTPADVTFPPCPLTAVGTGEPACIKVDVFRTTYNRAGGNPLPTFFGNLVGVTEQGVRATATAQVLYGESTDCVKPWAIPDKWVEGDGTPWDENDTFERYVQNGKNRGQLISPNPDLYVPPIGVYETDPYPGYRATYGDEGTGFTPDSLANGGDYGRFMKLKAGNPNQAIAPGWFFPVVIDPECGTGGDCYRDSISGCSKHVWGPGDKIANEPGNMIGPTSQGVEALIAQDPNAKWGVIDKATGKMGIVDSDYGVSPRLVALPVFDVDEYNKGQASGRQEIVVTKILGFFIEKMVGNDVHGYLMTFPTLARGTSTTPNTSFLISIVLVR